MFLLEVIISQNTLSLSVPYDSRGQSAHALEVMLSACGKKCMRTVELLQSDNSTILQMRTLNSYALLSRSSVLINGVRGREPRQRGTV